MLNLPIKISGPICLGIHWSHDSSVSLCTPEGIIFSLAEERVSRIKHYYGFPYRSIEIALKVCGLQAKDIDYISFSTKTVLFPEHRNYKVVYANGVCTKIPVVIRTVNRKLRQIISSTEVKSNLVDEFKDRLWSNYTGFLQDLGLMNERIRYYYVAHHRAHAASAFRLSGLGETCIITVDGKGDGLSATIYKGYNSGKMELLRTSLPENSIGLYYQALTEALGFVPADGEYKTMGLAALGSDKGKKNPFMGIISCKNGMFLSKIKWKMRSYNKHNPTKKVPNPLSSVSQTEDFKKYLDSFSPEDMAYLGQHEFEQNMLDYAKDAMKIAGSNAIAGAGGVMLNVKANALIRDKLEPSDFFVFPDSPDSGLAVGSAMETLYQSGCLKKKVTLKQLYLGHSYSDTEIDTEIANYRNKHKVTVKSVTPSLLAELLIQGKVLGTFQGRLEMGPRALGNRSVLADARTNTVKDRINLILKGREWFVPFAPIVLLEDASLYWNGKYDYYYMTFAVKASEYAQKTVPAVVHVDGTMRPQVVTKEYNPWLYEVLTEYKKRTGVGVLINTSFNRHGLPIVGSPADALDHLINGWVDGLIVGKLYVERV